MLTGGRNESPNDVEDKLSLPIRVRSTIITMGHCELALERRICSSHFAGN